MECITFVLTGTLSTNTKRNAWEPCTGTTRHRTRALFCGTRGGRRFQQWPGHASVTPVQAESFFYRFPPPHPGRADPKFPLLHSIGGNNNYNSYCIHTYVHTYTISMYTRRAHVGGTILQRFSTGWYRRTIYADVLEKKIKCLPFKTFWERT